MESHNFLAGEVKQLDIVDYLEKLGHRPQKIRNNDYWYLSPLREEKEPSFKVNRKLNVWYDHGLGKGGNIIDLGNFIPRLQLQRSDGKTTGNFFFSPADTHGSTALFRRTKPSAIMPLNLQ